MREPTPAAIAKLLATCARGDVVAPYSHVGMLFLEQRKLVASRSLFQPNGRLARSKLFALTEAGREQLAAGR